jgi:hypothetical protein
MEMASSGMESQKAMRQPPVGKRRRRHDQTADEDDDERHEHADGGRGLDPAGGVSAPVIRRVLRHVGGGAAVLTAQRQALGESQEDEDDRGGVPDGLEGGQEADEDRREAHHDDGDQEGVLAPYQVADAAEDERSEGPDQESGRVGREGGEQRAVWLPGGKKSPAKNGARIA